MVILETKRKAPIRFKRWKRAPWAAFASMGRVIIIGVLSVTSSILALGGETSHSQGGTTIINPPDSVVNLSEVQISSEKATPFQPLVRVVAVIQRSEIERAAVQNLPDLLRHIQGIDYRSRGSEGVQADINILGGTFDQTMIMINGVNFTDPQTGHHSLNIPIEINQIERIEVLHGAGAWAGGAVAYSGAINIITKGYDGETRKLPTEQNKILAGDIFLSGGSFGYFKTSNNLEISTPEKRSWKTTGQIGGGYSRSDGFAENTDFKILNLYSNITVTKDKWNTISLQAGYQQKSFGANSFYTPKFPNQFESTRLLLSSIKYLYEKENFQFSGTAYQRRHFDRFELFRSNAPASYKGHNYHQNDIYGATLQAAYRWGAFGSTIIGIDYRFEHIFSSLLGHPLIHPKKAPFEDDIFYTKGLGRSIPSLYIKHILQLQKLRLTGGLMWSNTYQDQGSYGARIYGGIAAAYKITPNIEVNGWINNSYRNPSFTDLFYKSPNQTGNKELKPEEAIASQLGVRYTSQNIRAAVSTFYRYGYRIIDWCRKSNSDQWASTNLTNVTSIGIETSASYHLYHSWINSAGVSYSYLSVNKETNDLHSLYATDYLKHKASIYLDHKIVSKLSARWDLDICKRAGSYLDITDKEVKYTPFSLVNIRLMWDGKFASGQRWQLFAEVYNLLNKDYMDIGNVPQPGRWIKCGIDFKL